MLRRSCPTTVLLVLVATASACFAQVPDSLSFQGLITDSVGAPVNDPSVPMVFKLYQDGSEVWTETQPSVSVENGVFDVFLGAVNPVNSVSFDKRTEVGVAIDGDEEMTPRTILLPAPYALGLKGLDSLLARIDALEASALGQVLGATTNNTNASVSFGGKTGIEAADAMCKDTYGDSPTAHLCSYDELVKALGRGAIGDTASYSGDWTWTMSVGHDRNSTGLFNTVAEHTARNLLTGSCASAYGSRLRVDFGFTPADNDVLTGTHIEIETTNSCGSSYRLLCCL